MSNDLQKLWICAIQSSRDIGFLKNHLTIAYKGIDRLQDLNNSRSAEVVQLTTELQNQQLAHGISYQLLLNEKEHIITEYNKLYTLYQTEQQITQYCRDQNRNILSHYNERKKQNQD